MTQGLIKNLEQINKIRTAGSILAKTLKLLTSISKVGITGLELDQVAYTEIIKLGGKPAFLGFQNYPATICLSINEVVVHGIPTNRQLKSGDIFSIDLGVNFDGWYADAAITLSLAPLNNQDKILINTAQKALFAGIDLIKDNVCLGDIQSTIQKTIESANLGNVLTLTGHGIGQKLHEPPSIPNSGQIGKGPILKAGMVICLEPMVTLGTGDVVTAKDGWSVVSADNTRAAHFEHTILVTPTGSEVLTS